MIVVRRVQWKVSVFRPAAIAVPLTMQQITMEPFSNERDGASHRPGQAQMIATRLPPRDNDAWE